MNDLVWRVRELVCVGLLVRVSSERHLGEPQLYQREREREEKEERVGRNGKRRVMYIGRETLLKQILIQWTFHNPNSPVLEVVQISESFGLVNVYFFNGAYSIFYLMHHKY